MSKKKTFDEFINEYIVKHGTLKYIFDESTFKDSHTPMRIICPKHGEFWKSPKNILNYNCIKCSYELRAKNYKLTTEEFIKKAKKVHGDKYDYSKSIYEGTKIPIKIICPKHGEFNQAPNDHLNGKGCPKCSYSHLERYVEFFLNSNTIYFISQYHPKWLGKQSLDFFIPKYNIAIECQGKQHFGLGGWIKDYDFTELYERDKYKKELCNRHNIKIIYITEKKLLKKAEKIKLYKDNIFDINSLNLCILQKQS